jgi:hypothetical protein
MEYFVIAFEGIFITLAVVALVVSLIEHQEVWYVLMYIILAPVWLLSKLLTYLVNGSTALGRYILGDE